MARITIEREDPQLGSVSLILYSNQDIAEESLPMKWSIKLQNVEVT